MVVSTTVPVDAKGAKQVIRLVDSLEGLDDVQSVYINVEISDEVVTSL